MREDIRNFQDGTKQLFGVKKLPTYVNYAKCVSFHENDPSL